LYEVSNRTATEVGCPSCVIDPNGGIGVNSDYDKEAAVLKHNLSLTPEQIQWIGDDANDDEVKAIYNFLEENKDPITDEYTLEAEIFANQAIDYLINHPQYDFSHYQNWFDTKSKGKDYEYDENYWNNPNLTFTQQNLPSWNSYKDAYPKNTNGTYMTGADNIFNLVGGDVKQVRIDYPLQTNNVCALKVSIALNGAGINIPQITTSNGNPGTIQGADGNYYFLNAAALNSWMKLTFGTNPSTPTTPLNTKHNQYTTTQGGTNGVNFPTLLSGKKGIFTMIPVNSTNFGASGHCDIFDGSICAAGCYFGSANEINIWELD